MAKKSITARQSKRKEMVDKLANKRVELKEIIRNTSLSDEVREDAMRKLWAMPRNSNKIRLRNRCAITGRPRGVYKKFGLCRHMIRYYAMMGQIPGLIKSSW